MFDAIAIGGIYGDKQTLCKIVEWVVDELSEDKPKHLLGNEKYWKSHH